MGHLVRAGASAASCVPCQSHNAEQVFSLIPSAPAFWFESLACCTDEGFKTYISILLGALCGFCGHLGYRSRVALGSGGHQETAGLLDGQSLSDCPSLSARLFLTSYLSYGAPGVEFTGLHRDAATVTQMHFLPGQVSIYPLLPASGGPHPHVLLPFRLSPFLSLLLPLRAAS